MLSEKNVHTYTHTTNVIGGIFCLKVSGVLAESCKQTKKLAYRIIHLFYPLSQVKISNLEFYIPLLRKAHKYKSFIFIKHRNWKEKTKYLTHVACSLHVC